jgi:hypothetical protein
MSYNDKFPVISLRVDFLVKKKLLIESGNKKITINELSRSILEDYTTGKLISQRKNLDIELQGARLEKLKLENKLTQLKIDYFENFGTPLNPSSTRIISRKLLHQNLISGEVQDQTSSPYDESNKRLKCVNCNQLFTWINQSGFIDQIKEFTNHLKISHNRELNALEKDVIDNLEFQGASS